MANLKDLRIRIASVKSTQKITAAMKMVAAAKLRRAQEQAEAARPYAERMERMLGALAESVAGREGAPPLLAGTGADKTHLLILATSDRGLCGAFNSSIVRDARGFISGLLSEGKDVKILCVGRKGRDQVRREHGQRIIDTIEDVAKPALNFAAADAIARRLTGLFDEGGFDAATIIYNHFQSVMTQVVTRQQLVPFAPGTDAADASPPEAGAQAIYEYEPDEESLLAELLPHNLAIQVYRALLENNASEQGARMTAMDSATRNAGDMIDRLTLNYNRTRQAHITRELIEIISGAEAV